MTKLEFSDTSVSPGAESKERLIAAAMAHLEGGGAASFLVPIPGTLPPLFVALGTLSQLESTLVGRAQLTDN